MPKFQKGFPDNATSYIDPASDADFKKKHPVKYGVLVFCGIAGLVLPMVILLLITEVFFPAPNSGFLVLGMAGCIIIGIGIFNIVAAWIGQYLGHAVTIGCFFLGIILVAICCIVLYVPDIHALFNEDITDFYFASLLFFALPPIYYALFRSSVNSWLRRKRMSKTMIKRLKKGKRNYWWYEGIHNECDMGLLYYLNKFLTIVYPVSLVMLLAFGWLKEAAPIIGVAYAIISLATAIMSLFSSIQDNKDEFGAPFVLLRFNKRKRLCSIVLDLAEAAFPMLAAYADLVLVSGIFKSP